MAVVYFLGWLLAVAVVGVLAAWWFRVIESPLVIVRRWMHSPSKQPRLAGGPQTTPSLIDPAATRPDGAILARSVDVSAAPVAVDPAPAAKEWNQFASPRERLMTLIATRPRGGKTQAQIALMVSDIAHGAEVYWLNPHYTYYHPVDQPTDLRPIQHLFTAVADPGEILRWLKLFLVAGRARLPRYRAGEDAGHDISIHIDEWPMLVSIYGAEIVDVVAAIVRELSKCNIWIDLATQDALKETTGFSSGLRSAYPTRLVGNVDDTTWRALAEGQKKQAVPRGQWMTDDGLIAIARPSAEAINMLARRQASQFPSLLATSPTRNKAWSHLEVTDAELAKVSTVLTDQEWLSAELEPETPAAVPPVPTPCTDGDHEVSALGTAGTPAGIGYPVQLSYLRDGKPVTVELTEERAAAIEKWLTLDRLSANQIAPKLRIARGAVYAMVAHVEGQLKSREVTV